tara:strand:+ start:135 stop:707 length:573 start_codon:yes stop_codon:yes gene_type:complete
MFLFLGLPFNTKKMKTSDTIGEIAKALHKFHSEVGKVKKGSMNPFFKSKYASLPEILDAISEPLTNSELVIIQFPCENWGLTTRLLHTSGEYFEETYFMKPVKETPQDAGSLISYQRRYCIGAVLNLNIDIDDDGNKASTPSKAATLLPLTIGSEEFAKCKQALSNGYTIGKIKSKYSMTAEVEKALLNG